MSMNSYVIVMYDFIHYMNSYIQKYEFTGLLFLTTYEFIHLNVMKSYITMTCEFISSCRNIPEAAGKPGRP